MYLMRKLSLIAWLLATSAAASGPTKVYIDSVPEYDLLQSCAEHQVSLVVRSMAFGCGDGSRLTSYACFCFQSSEYYSRMISTKVTSACSKTRGQDSSALEVFSKYCQLMDLEKVTTTDSAISEPTSSSSLGESTSASPASSPTTTTASPTANSASQTSKAAEPEKKDNIVAITTGVTLPVVVIALGLVGFMLYLHRRKRNPHVSGELSATTDKQGNEVPGVHTPQEKDTYSHVELDAGRPQELDTNGVRGELGDTTLERGWDRKIERLMTTQNNT